MSNSLDALSKINIGGLLEKPLVSEVNEISMDKIHEDTDNARTEYDIVSLNELADSIREHGVISPISLRKHDEIEGEFIINHGHRRYRASQIVGLTKIPAFLDSNIDTFGRLIENIQREDLSPLDIAKQLQIFESQGFTNRDISQKIGKSDSWVSRHLGLLDAPEAVKNAMDEGKVKSVEAAKTLSSLTEDFPDEVNEFLENSDSEISQKQVRDLAKDLKGDKKEKNSSDKPKKKPKGTDEDFVLVPVDSDSEDNDTDFSDAYLGEDDEGDLDNEAQHDKPKAMPKSPLIDLIKSINLSDFQVELIRDELGKNKYDDSFNALRDYINQLDLEI